MSKEQPVQLGMEFKFSLEETKNGYTSYLDDVYGLPGYTRADLKQDSAQEQYFNITSKLRVVHDYVSGVSFTRELKTGTCYFSPIPYISLFSDPEFYLIALQKVHSNALELRSTPYINAWLTLNSNYTYTGDRTVNNIPSSIFVADTSLNFDKPTVSEFAMSKVIYFTCREKLLV